MMHLQRLITGVIIACCSIAGIYYSVQSAHAQASVDACTVRMYKEIAREQRTYRSVLYGEPTATGAKIGTVLFDGGLEPWIKVQHNGENWVSVSGDPDRTMSNATAATTFGLSTLAASNAPNGTTRSDQNGELWVKVGGQWLSPAKKQTDKKMEGSRERGAKRGLFATRRVLTSELVPYLTQSMRAFQCNTYTICERVERSIVSGDGVNALTLHVPGCKERQTSKFAECNFAGMAAEDIPGGATVYRTCRTVVEAMVQQESDLLRLATEYDAAYRSILQIAGNFDLSLRTFKWPFVNTIRQAAGIIGQLGRIPCLLTACDTSPIDNNLPPW